jgi:hypothetical protein
MMTERPSSAEEIKAMISKEIDKRFELVGLQAETAEARAEARKDAAFVRAWRERLDDAARKVGHVVITALAVCVLGLLTLGFHLKIGGK